MCNVTGKEVIMEGRQHQTQASYEELGRETKIVERQVGPATIERNSTP